MGARKEGGDSIGKDCAEPMRLTTAISPTIPIFSYEPPNFKRHTEGAINIGNDAIHVILDDKEFSETLGYKGVKEQNITFDEYIWERFKKDGAQRTMHCLQVQLNAYLYKHSSKFKELYGNVYKELVEDNNFVCINDISAICDSCAQLQALKK